jgi:hypothetical protein
LGEDLDQDGEKNSLPVARLSEEFCKTLLDAILESDLFPHLCELGLKKGLVVADVAVEALEDFICFIVTFFLKEPTWRIWQSESPNQDNKRREASCNCIRKEESLI